MDIKLEHENENIEYKTSLDKLTNDIWSTYSAFANTNGGIIVLGVSEEKDGYIEVGVINGPKLIQDFWNTINNKEKVSKNILDNRHVQQTILPNGNMLIKIIVPEAHISDKPIYLNNNPKKTYIRLYEADCVATEEQLSTFFRDKSSKQDSVLLDNYLIEDLSRETIYKYKQYISKDRDSYTTMSDEEFLKKIGVYCMDRNDGRKYKLTEAALLFFGTEEAIRSRFSSFHLDYIDKRGIYTIQERWKDGVSFGDNQYADLNIFEFYLIVMDKLVSTINTPFKLVNGLERISYENFITAIREAFINTLVHADYHSSLSNILVEVGDFFYKFKNPGCLRVELEEFISGGRSNPRNDLLVSLFRRIGLSERIGSGGPIIFQIPSQYDYRQPELQTNLFQTELVIWSVDTITTIPNSTDEIRQVYNYLKQVRTEQSVTNLMNKLKISRYKIYKALEFLEEHNLLYNRGKTRNRLYQIRLSPVEQITMIDSMRKNIAKFMK
ncbi:RNA-binding domain-containing protein [Veillonella caviae]|uniref:RNA-binding domain-containing protein n=1 Tax=Veillonella caviae TaxID=248316 RepID=UPI002A91DD31|nr:RNA-binding domain-containing protein [Veillonella caviae]MDY5787090.1 putative DNA binding domain-containing protein [Veillonella caviae]